MYDRGLASTTAAPAAGRAGPRRRRPAPLCALKPAADPVGQQVERPWKPTLCRLPGVRRARGCPSPTTSQAVASYTRSADVGSARRSASRGRPRRARLGARRRLDAGLGLGLGQLGLELLGGRGGDDRDDERLGVGDERRCPRAGRGRRRGPGSPICEALDRDLDELGGMSVASASTDDACCWSMSMTAVVGRPRRSTCTATSTVTFSPRLTTMQVDVLDGARGSGRAGPPWAAPARCRRRASSSSRTLALFERQHRARGPGRVDVPRVGAVAVEHGGDLAGPAGPAGGALAELGAGLGGDLDLGHGERLLVRRCVRRRARSVRRGRRR